MGLPLFSLLFLLLLTPFVFSSTSDLTDLVYKGCANQKFSDPNEIYLQNLKSLFDILISQSSTANFYTTTAGEDQSAITGLFQCRGDLSTTDCNKCVKKLPDTLLRVCGGTIAARAQLGGCYMRYEVVGFRQVGGTELLYKQCGLTQASGAGFEERLNSALEEIEKGVGNGNGFYAGGYQSVYVLGQCEGDLKNGECVNCVKSAVEKAKSECGSSISGHIYLQQCYISYTYYPNGVPGKGTDGVEIEAGHKYNTQKTVAIVVGGVAGLGLGVAFLLVLKSAFKKKQEKFGGY